MFWELFLKRRESSSKPKEIKIIYDQKAVLMGDKPYKGYVLELSDDLLVIRCDDGFDRYVTDLRGWHFLTRDDRPELAEEQFKEFCLYKRIQRLGKENVMETYKETSVEQEIATEVDE